jgi:uncharacterized protein involved in outer membrane biogenesis
MKKAAIVLAVLLAAIALGVFWAYNSLDVIVKIALEHYGPDVAGVSVKVGEVTLSPRDGRGSVKGVEIGNPAGFSAPRAARLGEITLALDPATVRAPVVRVLEIVIDSPAITYERGASSTNLDAIQKNIEGYVKRAEAASDAGTDSTPVGRAIRHKFVIDRLAIRGAKVTMTNPGLKGQGVTFDLPDIELRDIGRREGGVTASAAANLVANALLAGIAQKVLTSMELLRQGGVAGAIDALKGLLK